MNITYQVNSQLPALAWIANVVKNQVKVICGRKVETRDNFWVEGAWGEDSYRLILTQQSGSVEQVQS